MSYSIGPVEGAPEDIERLLREAIETTKMTSGQMAQTFVNAEPTISAALAALPKIMETLTRPLSGDRVKVSISGHANENSEPVVGWSDDFVSFWIGQVPNRDAV